MGFIFAAHFCGSEMKSASIIVDATAPCCEADVKEENTSEDTGCCKNEYQLFKISDQFIPSEFLKVDFPIFAIQNNIAITPFFIAFERYQISKIFEFPPGQIQQQKLISTCVLRI
ncbi:MAG: hypothetical protein RJA76_2014 [Bacteroidota bacterium]